MRSYSSGTVQHIDGATETLTAFLADPAAASTYTLQ